MFIIIFSLFNRPLTFLRKLKSGPGSAMCASQSKYKAASYRTLSCVLTICDTNLLEGRDVRRPQDTGQRGSPSENINSKGTCGAISVYIEVRRSTGRTDSKIEFGFKFFFRNPATTGKATD